MMYPFIDFSMKPFLIVCVIAASFAVGAGGEAAGQKREVEQVYVFGDSYADTGNHDPESEEESIYKPWRAPYGYSWPGIPAGRYSDGRVFTDFFASYMGVKWPIPFRMLNISTSINDENYDEHSREKGMARFKGINFAFGGSGVFSTLNPFVPNVTTQIEQLRTTIDLGIVTMDEISKSLALFLNNGNDYIAYYELTQNITDITDFIPQVVGKMVIDLENLTELGFTNFVITNIGPLGCVPYFTYGINYTACVDPINELCDLHNNLLASQISSLQEKLPNATFLILDLKATMIEVIQGGTLSLRSCCEGVSIGSCGEVDESGNPLYTICSDVTSSLFWDSFHPTNNGWSTILEILLSSLQDSYHVTLPSLHDTYNVPIPYAKS